MPSGLWGRGGLGQHLGWIFVFDPSYPGALFFLLTLLGLFSCLPGTWLRLLASCVHASVTQGRLTAWSESEKSLHIHEEYTIISIIIIIDIRTIVRSHFGSSHIAQVILLKSF